MQNEQITIETKLKWYHYIAVFFAASFLTNFDPHFINGVSGNPFPSPFSNPPGKGLSSSLINVFWGMFNLIIGYILLRVSKMTSKNKLAIIIFFIGILLFAMMLSLSFVDKYKM